MLHRSRQHSVLLALILLSCLTPSFAFDHEQARYSALATIKGSALLPSGEPASGFPVVVKEVGGGSHVLPHPDEQRPLYPTIATGTTAADGTFSIQVRAPGLTRGLMMVEIGSSGQTPFLRKTVQMKEREVDLQTVQLQAPIKGDRSGSSCFLFSLWVPLGLVSTAWALRRRSEGG